MATEYTIGELAKAADVASSTLRYYERRGLVEPDNRSEGNYRLYGPETLERVRFIRAAQATGFTLDDVAMLLDVRVAANAACEAQWYRSRDEPPSGSVGRCQSVVQVTQFHTRGLWPAGFVGRVRNGNVCPRGGR